MAELERKDIISDDALQAPALMVAGLEKMVTVLTKIRSLAEKESTGTKAATSIKAVTDSVKNLVEQDKELVKIQNQLATVMAKNTEEYAEQKKKVDSANEALKTRIALGDRDAQSINKQNASLKELQAALAKNRQEYAKLTNEQARSSKQGQQLLKTIQQQDKDVKALNVTMGKHQDNVGNYAQALEGLDGVAGGVIGRFQQLGKQFLSLLSNPIVAIIAALAGAFIALNKSVNTYYETTAKGEEAMQNRQATWDAFFLTLKQGWSDVGKSVSEAFGEKGLSGLLAAILFKFSPALAAKFLTLEEQSQKLAATMRKLVRDHIKDIVDDANTEVKANAQLEISRDKLNKTAEERQAALQEHNRLRKEQLQGDIQLAKDDIAAEVQRLTMLGRRVDGQRLISEMTEEELKATGLMAEEVDKLGKLQAALLKVQSDGTAARIGLLKLEKALNDEIHKEKIDALNEEFEKSIATNQEAVNARIKQVQDEVITFKKTKVDGDKEIAAIIKANAAQLIEFQIAGLEKMIASTETTAEEDAEIAKRIAKLKIDLNNAVYNNVTTLDEATVKSSEKTLEKLTNMYGEFFASLSELFGAFSDRRIQGIDEEEAALDKQLATDLKNAGDNDAFKAELEKNAEKRREELDKKRNEARRKQAVADKAAAVVKAGITFAQAILEALAGGPPPFNLALAAITAAVAGVQLAAVAASPIPKFAKGTSNAPEGLAVVGEKGSELKVTPSGKMSLTPGVPTLDYLEAGTKIIPHDQTVKMLAMQSLYNNAKVDSGNYELYGKIDLMVRENKENTKKVVSAIIRSAPGNLFSQGELTFEQKIKEDASREIIRRTNLGR